MILSVLRLSRSDFGIIRNRNKGVFDTYTLHKIVYSLFPKEGEKERDFLFAYKGGSFSEKDIIILSEDKPLISDVGEISSKEIPTEFLQQDYYGFEVQMNPVYKDNKTGKVVAIRGSDKEALTAWFLKKSSSFGFEVQKDSFSIGNTDVITFKKDEKTVTLGKAVFTGRLRVTDRELFINSFKNGLGKGKAFGFGLLQIIPLTKASVDA